MSVPVEFYSPHHSSTVFRNSRCDRVKVLLIEPVRTASCRSKVVESGGALTFKGSLITLFADSVHQSLYRLRKAVLLLAHDKAFFQRRIRTFRHKALIRPIALRV